jgi:hypothetical protein
MTHGLDGPAPAGETAAMEVGDVVEGRFELRRRAAAGGMGVVFEAHDRLTHARVAVKSMLAERGSIERFAREARILAELRHPAIVSYLAHGTARDGTPWLAMEWLEGMDLATRLGRDGALTEGEALAVVRQIASALGAAHTRGIVHRDVKPANVFLVDGISHSVRMLDFGIALIGGAASALTRTGMVVGTPGYVSPEQARGADVDATTDVFALGCVLFECLTGRPAFVANSAMALLAKILFEDVPDVREVAPHVSGAVASLTARLLTKEVGQRPRNGADVVDLLRDLVASSPAPTQARPPRSFALSSHEQRVECVVAVGPPAQGNSAALAPEAVTETTVNAPLPAATVSAVETARSYGGRAEVLADGSLVIAFSRGENATDQAVRAAAMAEALKHAMPSGAIVLATGRSLASGHLPTGEVVDRAADMLQRAAKSTSAIVIDDLSAALLETRFEIARHAGDGIATLGARRDELGGGRTLLGKQTRCVGRDAELAALMAMWDQCTQEPTARVWFLKCFYL